MSIKTMIKIIPIYYIKHKFLSFLQKLEFAIPIIVIFSVNSAKIHDQPENVPSENHRLTSSLQ